MILAPCTLCESPGGRELWRDAHCRVVAVDDLALPGFLRVILHAHAAEMTDLAPADQAHVMQLVLATEALLRRYLSPDKVNLASLGNVVPHLHWHVIPRWRDDAWFPDPIWAPARRAVEVPESRLAAAQAMTERFKVEIAAVLGASARV